MRVGYGYDVHRLVVGRPLILGGVHVPYEKGLAGHSDADVLLHSISDALLGALALGDIGVHFPDTDEKWKGADSSMLLREIGQMIYNKGYVISNIDSTVALQQPKLRPYIDQMRNKIAATLEMPVEDVSVKATTTEKLGFVGSGEGASAHAVCLLLKKD